MTNEYDSIFWLSLILLATYWLHLLRKQPLGASHIFIGLLLFFHGPAIIFYRDIWSVELGFGLLNRLSNTAVASDRAILSLSIAFTIITVTKITSNLIYPITKNHIASPHSLHEKQINYVKVLTLLSAAIILIALTIQYTMIASPQKIIDYYFADMSDYERGMIRREGNLGSYFFGVLIESIIPFISFIVLSSALMKNPKRTAALAISIIILVLLAKLSRFTKAGPTLYLLQIFLCYWFVFKKTFLVTKKDIWFVIVSIFATLMMVIGLGSGGDLLVAFDRLLMIPNEVVFEYFAAIPEFYPFGYGRGISYVQAIFGDAIGSASPLPVSTHVAAVTRGYTGTVVNGLYILDAWAEFGWIGIIFFSLFTGILLHWLDRKLSAIRYRPIKIALIAFLLSGMYTLVTSSVTSTLVTGGVLIVPILALYIDRMRDPALK
jgi:oligosaccharide repeat unit polymerase